ncbi:hypothetical protein BJF90_31965 [Pseudonocardia sp. CNS-004]|nr:hypothetical protein BJF90_31965 [Pseudonocardia sp. CNS-004]
MTDVQVKVPEERLPEFYAMYASWLAAPAGTPPEPLVEATSGYIGSRLPAWTSDDGELARIVWGKLTRSGKNLVSALVDADGTPISGDELAEQAGIKNGKSGVAGALGWPGRHSFAVNRTWFWCWEYPDGNAVYWLDEVVIELFRQARDGK